MVKPYGVSNFIQSHYYQLLLRSSLVTKIIKILKIELSREKFQIILIQIWKLNHRAQNLFFGSLSIILGSFCTRGSSKKLEHEASEW